MSDELTGQAANEPTPEPQPGVDGEPRVAEDIPKEYQGKSAAEIAKMHQELTGKLTEQGDELGKLRKQAEEIEAYKRYYQETQPILNQLRNQPPAPQPQPQPAGDIDFFDKPAESFGSLYEQRRSKERQMEAAQQAMTLGPIVKQQAKMQFPQAFEGVDEAKVEQYMRNLPPQFSMRPEGWQMVAWQVKGEQMNYHVPTPGPSPSDPARSELPAGTKGAEADYGDVHFDGESHRLMQEFGYDEKEAAKMVREQRAERERRS